MTMTVRPTVQRLFSSRPDRRGRPLRVGIVGAGFGGIGMAIQLQRAGIDDFTIFEKADGIGGVWRDNTYPDAGCDVPSHLYSYSFARRSTWSRRFPKQPEILDYLRSVVTEHGLDAHLRFGTEVTSATWDDATNEWELTTGAATTSRFDVVVWGLGQLNRPKWPDIDGIDAFEGTIFHSARWNHDHDLTGDRVAVIGNGASAVQFVPPVAERAARLYQFQRAPNWFLPKPDAPFTASEIRRFRRIPGWERLHRSRVYASFESKWIALRRDSRISRTAQELSTRYITAHVPDPGLRAKLVPDYPVGCKRILITDNYLDTLCRDDVEVVDDPITRITAHAVVTADGTEREVDTIVVATGFDTLDFLAPVKIVGSQGRDLATDWVDGASAYQGIAVPGYPNSFILYGPNTNLNHNSIIFMLECQYRWILGVIGHLGRGARRVDVDPGAARRYGERIDAKMLHTVFAAGCDSWYKNAQGKVTNNWPGPTVRYWWDTRRVRTADLVID